METTIRELKASSDIRSGDNGQQFTFDDKAKFLDKCYGVFNHNVPNSALHEVNTICKHRQSTSASLLWPEHLLIVLFFVSCNFSRCHRILSDPGRHHTPIGRIENRRAAREFAYSARILAIQPGNRHKIRWCFSLPLLVHHCYRLEVPQEIPRIWSQEEMAAVLIDAIYQAIIILWIYREIYKISTE